MGHVEHRQAGPASVPCSVITISDTRDRASDTSGRLIKRALLDSGHRVVSHDILKDEPRRIAAHLRALAAGREARVVLLTGGTGIAERDTTHEAVSGLLEKTLPGFGEIFRALSYRQIGPSAMLSRAVAGTWRGMAIFSMPGSPEAVRLAMRRLILPELSHVAGLLEGGTGRKHGRPVGRGSQSGRR
jgi:molybdenum cofactor biosynthesis protein B